MDAGQRQRLGAAIGRSADRVAALEEGFAHLEEALFANDPDRRIALTPPALEALEMLPRRTGLVFRSKQGRRLSQPTLSGYWGKVLARAGLECDFYLATKHWAVHHL
jgi:hypothetical protein